MWDGVEDHIKVKIQHIYCLCLIQYISNPVNKENLIGLTIYFCQIHVGCIFITLLSTGYLGTDCFWVLKLG